MKAGIQSSKQNIKTAFLCRTVATFKGTFPLVGKLRKAHGVESKVKISPRRGN